MLAYSDNYFLFYIYWATAHSEMKRSEIEADAANGEIIWIIYRQKAVFLISRGILSMMARESERSSF